MKARNNNQSEQTEKVKPVVIRISPGVHPKEICREMSSSMKVDASFSDNKITVRSDGETPSFSEVETWLINRMTEISMRRSFTVDFISGREKRSSRVSILDFGSGTGKPNWGDINEDVMNGVLGFLETDLPENTRYDITYKSTSNYKEKNVKFELKAVELSGIPEASRPEIVERVSAAIKRFVLEDETAQLLASLSRETWEYAQFVNSLPEVKKPKKTASKEKPEHISETIGDVEEITIAPEQPSESNESSGLQEDKNSGPDAATHKPAVKQEGQLSESMIEGIKKHTGIDKPRDVYVIEQVLSTINSLESIKENDGGKINLAEYGINNTQVFTRRVEVDRMIDSIGAKKVEDSKTTILEPTSGDGAFTVRILERRLEKLSNVKDIAEYLHKSAVALSTIYSIEYEYPSLAIQRNNLYTLLKNDVKRFATDGEFAKENDSVILKWDELIRRIILSNIVWGAFSTKMDGDYGNYEERIVGTYRSNGEPISFRKWKIDRGLKYKFSLTNGGER